MISIVIPAYNEATNVDATITEALAALGAGEDAPPLEAIVVDDHSDDGTFDTIAALSADNVRCIRLSRRSGSHTAIRAGLSVARGDAVIVMAADGQDDPIALREMVLKWRSGAQIVWALRRRRQESWFSRATTRVFYGLLGRMVGQASSGIDISRADFWLMDRRVIDAVNACPERNTSLFGLLLWMGFAQESVDYDRRPRRSGSSKWRFASRVALAKDWIIAFSGTPLRFATWLGALLSTVAMLSGLGLVGVWLFGSQPVAQWSLLAVAVCLIGGIQLLALGAIGEYLWRGADESRRRPPFFIEGESGWPDGPDELP